MYKIENLENNPNVVITDALGPFKVCEYKADRSISVDQAAQEYYASKMNIRKKQLLCTVSGHEGIVLQAGAMQWMAGNVSATTGVKGVGDFFGKMIGGAVTGEAGIKPEYQGEGVVMSEPTYKYILLVDAVDWGKDGIVLEDGMFLACSNSLKRTVISRKTLSSAAAGGEGLFNLCLKGEGIAALESPYPANELIAVDLQNDTLKIDGSLAVAWSASLDFTVERAGKSLIGSAASGEGLVNVYRGTGRVLMAPVA